MRLEEIEKVARAYMRMLNCPPGLEHTVTFSVERGRNVNVFLHKGMTVAKLLECIDIAAAATRYKPDLRPRWSQSGPDDAALWRYFCGVCWQVLRAGDTQSMRAFSLIQK